MNIVYTQLSVWTHTHTHFFMWMIKYFTVYKNTTGGNPGKILLNSGTAAHYNEKRYKQSSTVNKYYEESKKY